MIHGEMDRVSQQLTQRVKQLAERYEETLPHIANRVAELEARSHAHLRAHGIRFLKAEARGGWIVKGRHPDGYMQTELGVIPDGLGCRAIVGELCVRFAMAYI